MDRILRNKRFIAGFMILVLVFMSGTIGVRVDAAEKQALTYIKEFKLFIDKDKDPGKAKDWFEKNGYTMIEGNLNADASGALKSEVGVYMGYSTTTERDEAVTDLAVMNERGNYSMAEYEKMLKEQKKMYTDMVSDMKTMIREYRRNIKRLVPTALRAREFMNSYKDDDSGQYLGDLLRTIKYDDLVTLLMQANGQVVLMIQEQLAYACGSGDMTWLDRMVKIGSYKNLRSQALKAVGNNANQANRLLDKKYREAANILVESWGDIRQHIINVREKIKEWGIDDKNEKEIESFLEENKDNPEVKTFYNEHCFIAALALYPYEGESLAEYFEQSSEEFSGDGIRKLYPLVAALSDGQLSAVNQSVSIFTLFMDALSACTVNGYKSDIIQKIIDKIPEEDKDKKEFNEVNAAVDETFDDLEDEEALSIYAGVDREVYKGGVAVTSTAYSFSNGDGRTWADDLVDSVAAKSVAATAMLGSVACFVSARVAARTAAKWTKELGKLNFAELGRDYYNAKILLARGDFWVEYTYLPKETKFYDLRRSEIIEKYQNYPLNDVTAGQKYNGPTYNVFHSYDKQTDDVKACFQKKAEEFPDNAKLASKVKFYKKLQVGLTVAGVVLAVSDIVMTAITLYNYYNRDHLPIPGYMADLCYNEDIETSIVYYKNVPDQSDDCGDVNGGGGKQWLALYQTHDKDAGEPLLAPENGEEFKIIVQYGSSEEPKTEGYTPLHLFGTPDAPQNLTYADGESGWSYNDGKKGTYVFFRRDNEAAADSESDDEEIAGDADAASGEAVSGPAVSGPAVSSPAVDAGSALSGGTVALIGTGCGLVGIFIGAMGLALIRRKKNV